MRKGSPRLDETRRDETRQDKTRPDPTRQDPTKTRQDKTRQDKTKQDPTKTRQEKTRKDKTRKDKTRQNKKRQNKTRQDKTRQHNTRQHTTWQKKHTHKTTQDMAKKNKQGKSELQEGAKHLRKLEDLQLPNVIDRSQGVSGIRRPLVAAFLVAPGVQIDRITDGIKPTEQGTELNRSSYPLTQPDRETNSGYPGIGAFRHEHRKALSPTGCFYLRWKNGYFSVGGTCRYKQALTPDLS